MMVSLHRCLHTQVGLFCRYLVCSYKHIKSLNYIVSRRILHDKNEASSETSLLTGVYFTELSNFLKKTIGWDNKAMLGSCD